jgi:hypothetical protein
MVMMQDERWNKKYQEVVLFVENNKRNPSKHIDEERGLYLNWLKHNRKLMNKGEMKMERVEKFRELMEVMERYRRKNQPR